jgi:hypothetical protein
MFTESETTADGYDYEIDWSFDPSRPWSDFFDFVWRMDCDPDGLDFILLGSGDFKNRCVVRDRNGWWFTVGIVVDYGFAGYDDDGSDCDLVWYVA